MPERRKKERRKWGRKVTYPYSDSDGVVVTNNRRRLVDRRVQDSDSAIKNENGQKKYDPTNIINSKLSAVDLSVEQAEELEKTLQEKTGLNSGIDQSIKNSESEIIRESVVDSNKDSKIKGLTEEGLPPVVKNYMEMSIELEFKGDIHILSESDATCLLGRDPSCDVTVPGRYVSRTHATIIFKNGKFLLKDDSFNGTYIRFNNGSKIHVSSEKQILDSNGVMSLGEPIKNNSKMLVEFKII